MNFKISEHIPQDFNDQSRVWIYQSNRIFNITEAFILEEKLKAFVAKWSSHGSPVRGYANLFFGRFLVFIADESATTVSGCSTDSSVHIVKEIEKEFGVNMFDRQLLCFYKKEKVEQIPLSQISYALANSILEEDDLYFDNTVLTKSALQDHWLKPIKDSWLKKYVASPTNAS